MASGLVGFGVESRSLGCWLLPGGLFGLLLVGTASLSDLEPS